MRLVRLGTLVVLTLGLLLGGILTHGLVAPQDLGSAATVRTILSAWCLGLAASCHGLRTRPSPPSWMPAALAWTLSVAAVLAALAIALTMSLQHVAVIGLAVVLLATWRLVKARDTLVHVILLPGMYCLVLLYGGLLGNDFGAVILAIAMTLLFFVSSGLIRAIQTAPDQQHATYRRAACRIICLGILMTPLPFLFLDYRGIYLLLMLVADGFFLSAYWLLSSKQAPDRARSMLHFAMALTAIALAFGAIVQLGD